MIDADMTEQGGNNLSPSVAQINSGTSHPVGLIAHIAARSHPLKLIILRGERAVFRTSVREWLRNHPTHITLPHVRDVRFTERPLLVVENTILPFHKLFEPLVFIRQLSAQLLNIAVATTRPCPTGRSNHTCIEVVLAHNILFTLQRMVIPHGSHTAQHH